jgi:hypothetical protein
MQFGTKLKAGVIAVVVAGAAAAAVLVGPAGPALGFFSPPLLLQVHVNSPATLVARGAGVDVSVTVQCGGLPRGESAFLQVGVTQHSGSGIASGFGDESVGCTGGNETFLVPITAQAAKAFKTGPAIGQAFIQACTFRFCGSEQDQRTITLTK